MQKILSVLLGVFVMWEIVMIPAANLSSLWWPEHTSETTSERIAGRWNDLTGNHQGWPLFAGESPAVSPFPAVRGQWVDGHTLEVRSSFEPVDAEFPIRRPLVANRVFNLEMVATLYHLSLSPDLTASEKRQLGQETQKRARTLESTWRIYAWHAIPDEVSLVQREVQIRILTATERGGHRRVLQVYPLIRWRSELDWQPEFYDLSTGEYLR